jgi:hypothetical protein
MSSSSRCILKSPSSLRSQPTRNVWLDPCKIKEYQPLFLLRYLRSWMAGPHAPRRQRTVGESRSNAGGTTAPSAWAASITAYECDYHWPTYMIGILCCGSPERRRTSRCLLPATYPPDWLIARRALPAPMAVAVAAHSARSRITQAKSEILVERIWDDLWVWNAYDFTPTSSGLLGEPRYAPAAPTMRTPATSRCTSRGEAPMSTRSRTSSPSWSPPIHATCCPRARTCRYGKHPPSASPPPQCSRR